MEFTQNAIALLAATWALQIAGSWIQWRHYRTALRQATGRFQDGFLGMGHCRPRLGLGAIALLEVGPDLRARSLQAMAGLSVFARFRPLEWATGRTLAEIEDHCHTLPAGHRLAVAVRQALEQVELARQRRAEPAGAAAPVASRALTAPA